MGAPYNATVDLLERNLSHRDRPALRQDGRITTYGALCERANRAGNALRALGVQMEQRVLLCMLDTPDLPAVFWGAMKAGLVPVHFHSHPPGCHQFSGYDDAHEAQLHDWLRRWIAREWWSTASTSPKSPRSRTTRRSSRRQRPRPDHLGQAFCGRRSEM